MASTHQCDFCYYALDYTEYKLQKCVFMRVMSMYVYMYAYVHVCACMCTCVCMHVYVCVLACVCLHMYVCARMCTCVCLCLHVYMCVLACVCICTMHFGPQPVPCVAYLQTEGVVALRLRTSTVAGGLGLEGTAVGHLRQALGALPLPLSPSLPRQSVQLRHNMTQSDKGGDAT